VDKAVQNVGRTRSVGVDSCAHRCELPGRLAERPMVSCDNDFHLLWTEIEFGPARQIPAY